MIKTGGENVASREVEEVIYRHPASRRSRCSAAAPGVGGSGRRCGGAPRRCRRSPRTRLLTPLPGPPGRVSRHPSRCSSSTRCPRTRAASCSSACCGSASATRSDRLRAGSARICHCAGSGTPVGSRHRYGHAVATVRCVVEALISERISAVSHAPFQGRIARFDEPGMPFEIETVTPARHRSRRDPGQGHPRQHLRLRRARLARHVRHPGPGRAAADRARATRWSASFEALGDGVFADSNGAPLAAGTRVVFPYFFCCHTCRNCLAGRAMRA